MYLELDLKYLFDEISEAISKYERGEKIDFSEINHKIEQLLHGAEVFHKMIDDRRKITNKDFYIMLNEFSYISNWDDHDCYNVFKMAYNMKFAGDAVIKTTMHAFV